MPATKRSLLNTIARPELLLVGLLTASIFMMILPLPTTLVDFLIAMNFGIAIILMMMVVYVRSASAFTTFPSILLLTTLVKLALSITTTRLILLEADAGQIIQTFGEFVIAGSLVVGLIIFLIITLVQFIVITKGAERVAEVAARFSLDGMPGKQLSIDSDLRSGLITIEQARSRREELESQSQLYGAMDGAMKFIKGDAIAGILIILVNILGGLAVGTTEHGMAWNEALEVFAILTIGDGLVSQIPALIIAIAAGMLVTRTASVDERNLGEEITHQFKTHPNALMIAGLILLVFAAVPGFPAQVFGALALLLGLTGYFFSRRNTRMEDLDPEAALVEFGEKGTKQITSTHAETSSPVLIKLPQSSRQSIPPEQLEVELGRVRQVLFDYLGVNLPAISVHYSEQLEDEDYEIFIRDVPAARGKFEFVYSDSPQNQSDQKLLQQDAAVSATLETDPRERSNLSTRPGEVIDVETFLRHLTQVLRKHAGELMGTQETHELLENLSDQLSFLIKDAQRALPVPKISEILRRLLSEDIAIRDMRTILEAIVEWSPQYQDPDELTEFVRIRLNRLISHRFSFKQDGLKALVIDPDLESTLVNAVRRTPTGSYLELPAEQSEWFIKEVRQALVQAKDTGRLPVLLTSLELRRFVRSLLTSNLVDLPVLSYKELANDVNVEPVGNISLAGAAA